MFQKELEFFKRNQDMLVSKYKGKTLVIKGHEIVGAYQTALEAYKIAQSKYEAGTFMLQPCEPGTEAYTVTISSHEVVTA